MPYSLFQEGVVSDLQRFTVGLFICQNVSDFQISNSFEKLRSFYIKVILYIFF